MQAEDSGYTSKGDAAKAKHPGGRPRSKRTEYAITHHSTQPEGGKGHWTNVIPPPVDYQGTKGPDWEIRELTASHHSTHILWRRTVDIEVGDE
jgi:hypothetical protein